MGHSSVLIILAVVALAIIAFALTSMTGQPRR
jgi:hypothetical protein